MSKALSTEAILTRFSTTADNAIRFSGVTPELDSSQKVALMELHGKEVVLLIQPKGIVPDEIIMVKTDIEQRTPSERLRAVLFIRAKQVGKEKEFDHQYRIWMSEIIEDQKAKLEPGV